MSAPRQTPEDIRALLSDHLEGALDDVDRRAVDEALAADPALAAEHRRLAATLRALKALPRPEAPADLVARVRAGIDAAAAPSGNVLPLHRALNDDVDRAAHPRRRGLDLFAGLAAAAAVVAVVAIAVPGFRGGRGGAGVLGAGVTADQGLGVTWRAPGLPRAVVFRAAAAAGLTLDADNRFVGDRDAVARFLVALKTEGATRGVDVAGVVPEQAAQVTVAVVVDE